MSVWNRILQFKRRRSDIVRYSSSFLVVPRPLVMKALEVGAYECAKCSCRYVFVPVRYALLDMDPPLPMLPWLCELCALRLELDAEVAGGGR